MNPPPPQAAADPERWCAAAADYIAAVCRARGAAGVAVGISGGLDSAVVAALAARALGPQRVLGVWLPERDSCPQSARLARALAQGLGLTLVKQSLTRALRALGAYRLAPRPGLLPRRWQVGYVRRQLSRAARLGGGSALLADTAAERDAALARGAALCRAKVRLRMLALHLQAEPRHLLVAGTCNRTEWLTGLFAPWGDPAADLLPLRNVCKTDVRRLARHLPIPAPILERAPAPDLAPGLTDEDLLGIPYPKLDRILAALEPDGATPPPESLADCTAQELDLVRQLLRRSALLRSLPDVFAPPARLL